jgi:predicted N-acetyltransferase YhbS
MKIYFKEGEAHMGYEFSFYVDEDFNEIEQIVLASYQWEYPIWGLSRHEFTRGLHPAFTGHYHAWRHTVGVYRENNKVVACVINEGDYNGEAFFLFDSKERGEDRKLLKEMIKFAKTHVSNIKEDRRTKSLNLYVPTWNTALKEMVLQSGFHEMETGDELYILPFDKRPFEVKLPNGYNFADGNTVPDFYLSNTHRLSFGYGGNSPSCEHGEQAFHELRKMKHYRKNLDLCVLDEQKRPIAMAIIWYDESMPYCELEPLGVVWWERRKGIATAILHEAANRVQLMFPKCMGMTGGDQTFYKKIGYEKKAFNQLYHWELEVFISWETESYDKDYAKEV